MSTPRVAFVQRVLPHYRVPFFEQLRENLAASGIEMDLYYGEPAGSERMKKDTATLPWAFKLPGRDLGIGRRKLHWQGGIRRLWGYDLVIVEQATRLIANYLLLFGQKIGGPRVAFWGHGRNMKVDASRSGEAVKRLVSRRPHWWFAYNDATEAIVRGLEYPAERITVVQNTIDVTSLRQELAALGGIEKRNLGLDPGLTGVFLGSLYAEKRISYLIESARLIRERIPSFQLLVLGSGPDAKIVLSATSQSPWIKYVGPIFEAMKARYLAISDVMLIPGAVGLVTMDSFASQVPIITVDGPSHGPELSYLVNGDNSQVLERGTTPFDYSSAVVKLLNNPAQLAVLKEGCRHSADRYTMQEMVRRFAGGIRSAIE